MKSEKFDNGLEAHQEERLVRLIEECSEVIKASTKTVASRMHAGKSHARPANGSRTSDPSGRIHRATQHRTVQRALHERGPLLDGGDHPQAKLEGASARTP